MWSFRRSAVQRDSAPEGRLEAFSALARATARLFAMRLTSEISGSSVGSIFGRTAGLAVFVFPVRNSLIHPAIWAIGPVMLQRTTIKVIADDQHGQDQEADEVVSPDLLEPDVDVRGIVEQRQGADRLSFEEEGRSVEIDPSVRGVDETGRRTAFRQDMDDLGAGSGDQRLEVGGRGQELATGVVHGDPLELFAVAEPLNEEVQSLRRNPR